MIEFELDKKDIARMLRALDRLDSKMRRLESQHPYSSAERFKDLLKKNMLSQKFAATYAAYSRKYSEWKTEKMLLGSRFWSLFGDLFRAITVFKAGRKAWMAGVPGNVHDQGGKSWFSTRSNRVGKSKPIAMYGRVEEGRRPVFKPTADEFAKEGWPEQGEKVLNELGKQWR